MTRLIVTPAVLPPSALAELKQWLGITTTLDDAPLGHLLAMAVDVCADYTGLIPLACVCEETIDLRASIRRIALNSAHSWGGARPQGSAHVLSTCPVRAVTAVSGLVSDGTRIALSADAFHVVLDAEGTCAVTAQAGVNYTRAVVTMTAGLADSWDNLPQPLRHGIIRLAAHQHRTRESSGADAMPPASVTAMWRPFRRMRLA